MDTPLLNDIKFLVTIFSKVESRLQQFNDNVPITVDILSKHDQKIIDKSSNSLYYLVEERIKNSLDNAPSCLSFLEEIMLYLQDLRLLPDNISEEKLDNFHLNKRLNLLCKDCKIKHAYNEGRCHKCSPPSKCDDCPIITNLLVKGLCHSCYLVANPISPIKLEGQGEDDWFNNCL